MKIAILGHSNIHPRQTAFLKTVASLGHQVLILAPGEWGTQRIQNTTWEKVGTGQYRVQTLRHFGGEDVYRFKFVGVEDALEKFDPDVLYVFQEPGSLVAQDCADMAYMKALFVWDNLVTSYTPFALEVLTHYDLVVCGNDSAENIVKKVNHNTVILPQVGVDTVHFQARPVKRDTSVAYIGRATPEKGVDKLLIAWPTTRVLAWQDYLQLPWWYSMCQIVVSYSQDAPQWREQAPPYVSVEAICCGAFSIVSDAGSIPFWHREYAKYAGTNPGVVIVSQNSIAALKNAIAYWVNHEEARELRASAGRKWVEENLSSKVIAKRLIECLSKLS